MLEMISAQFVSLAMMFHPPADESGQAKYLANEAVMITAGETKLLFDPIFDTTFGQYRQVPEPMRSEILEGTGEFEGVDAVFISHAHGDHFAADEVARYLVQHPEIVLYAPAQAVDMLTQTGLLDETDFDRIHGVGLERTDPAVVFVHDGMRIDAVRIPHAGWPSRAEVENLVWRVTVDHAITVMHMGDADPDDSHFAIHASHWPLVETGLAFPPYWFFLSQDGRDIVDERLNAREAIGVHVPVRRPPELRAVGRRSFYAPGEFAPVEPSEPVIPPDH